MEGSTSVSSDGIDGANKLECAVCLQPCIQPVQLPCRHIFCYLCVKGVTQQSKRCAMCRQEIPANYLDNPQLIAVPQPTVAFEGSYQWFYEGRNGWWQYDDRTSAEIEAAYKKGEQQCEVLIAGFLYIIDFQKNIQVRRCDPYRRRHIKRDLVTIPKKGIAGIRLPSDTVAAEVNTISLDNLTLSGEESCSSSDAYCNVTVNDTDVTMARCSSDSSTEES
ncbi:E3 ubiquitin-protein ligase RNF146-B-like isoform X1 [Stegodyphus dumicola]|uniref:E3 ubiquitin-protein ligase RNF146-B-like isoform X1 n=1 Tax=Stegodyphus dumicola TaxID=202533 RepID=UPI0015B1DD86|nr:E3 ubiquitin-protein ligase RNF146-B-like isoform X1 [Stegodyphus dumicola]XP_035216828.1 E3 ubiquitin-protein ligase RNF146-B-like isoform X1 [Stegodyphus dumicola]XP_035216829.1 E3 ubiquitin-protein ligase RNF146-B-like isoform X1 [Stegodyphus dumicola]